MDHQESKKGAVYFRELSLRLVQEGIPCKADDNNRLSFFCDGTLIGSISATGAVTVPKEYAEDSAISAIYDRVTDLSHEVYQYTAMMQAAPLLKASGLSEPYKLLAEFNGYVLAGTESSFGMQFVTWSRDYSGEGVTIGHYFGSHFSAAKQDFAERAGFLDGLCLFSDDQLAEIQHCCSEILDSGAALTYEQERRIQDISHQLQEYLPHSTQENLEQSSNEPQFNM